MVHDPLSLFRDNTYEDSLVIQVPSLTNCVLKGSQIPVEEGNYKYVGTVTISGTVLNVHLFIKNTSDHVDDPVSWNGTYELVK